MLFGGGAFDVSGEHPNQKGWDIFELGQRSFWAVPTALAWDEPVREDPRYSEAIAAMLSFLCPGEKMAVTGASCIAAHMQTEEAQFYFVEQALEEAKHHDALRRMIVRLTGRPLEPPKPLVRLLYTFGVIDRDDVAFMMGNINIIGEHLAHQIFHRINHVATDPQLRKLIALIGKDESRHIAAGQRFFPEVWDRFARRRHEILAKNLLVCLVLACAAYDLVRPMQTLRIDLAEVMEEMYRHYHDVVGGFGAFPDGALLEGLLRHLRWSTPRVIRAIAAMTTETGEIDAGRLLGLCREAVRSPRALRRLFA
ncbi:MAG: ferritin-like domain-containing protein [Myxococcales bacterium]|nr:ferritin-like domain-containing protein [Myxococcota bacterium]MDW8280940.1 ferritin-like domain-containing protein [Myxococcales bacterium]